MAQGLGDKIFEQQEGVTLEAKFRPLATKLLSRM